MMPGDLKYEDFNGDGVIDNNDIQPITRSNTPEIYFGLDLSASWKGFDFSLLMQGATNYNVYMSGCLGNAMFNGSNTLECFMDRWHREDLYDPESAWIPGNIRQHGTPGSHLTLVFLPSTTSAHTTCV